MLEAEGRETAERVRKVAKVPGRPTPGEVERHNVARLSFRSWCPACVLREAMDRMHMRAAEQEVKRSPDIVFDYAFLGSDSDGRRAAARCLSRLIVGHR